MRSKADVNSTNEHGNSPLHYACFWGYHQLAEDLVNQGAFVSLANKDGDSPLDKAKGSIAKRLHGKPIFYLYYELLFYFFSLKPRIFINTFKILLNPFS